MSNEANFTEGPWAAFQNEVGGWEVNCRGEINDEIGRYSPTVCAMWNVTYTKLDNKLQEPNAHLIAAAPEMYEMLSAISDCIELGQTEALNAFDIDSLLAKARGES